MKQLQRSARDAERVMRRAEQRRGVQEKVIARRAMLANMSIDSYRAKTRSMEDRRTIVRLQTLKARVAAASGQHFMTLHHSANSAAPESCPITPPENRLGWFAQAILNA